MNLKYFQYMVGKWSKETFPDATVDGFIDHMIDELEELRENPFDRHEYADVFLTLLDMANRFGINVAEASMQKFEWCKDRTWNSPDDRGVVGHATKGKDEQDYIEQYRDHDIQSARKEWLRTSGPPLSKQHEGRRPKPLISNGLGNVSATCSERSGAH